MVIANPIAPEFAMPEDVINEAIASALRMAEERNIHGKENTPFLLETIKELTHGQSLNSNIHLVLSNAALAASIAAAYCEISSHSYK